jgi:hypothetical protein
MKKLLFGAICLSVLVSAAGLFLTGCDEAEGLELIIVSPTEKEMTTRETTVWLTASFPGATKQSGDDTNSTSTVDFADPVDADDILHLPLEWSVANGALGNIIGSGGTSALYVRTPNTGVNRVTVEDQYGNVGYSDIRQMVEQYRLELTAVSGTSSNSAAYIPAGQVTATIRVGGAIGGDGPTAPFTWSVLFPTRGYIQAGQGSDTVVFRAMTPSGYNVVQCTDAYGVVGTIVVTQD